MTTNPLEQVYNKVRVYVRKGKRTNVTAKQIYAFAVESLEEAGIRDMAPRRIQDLVINACTDIRFENERKGRRCP